MATLYVPLTHGKIALIDEEDGPLVLAHQWRAFRAYERWYAVMSGGPHDGLRMHRFIMGAKPGELVDHENGDGLDNRRSENLRICTQAENNRNQRRLLKTNTSGYLGVSRWKKRDDRWQAAIQNTHIGVFATKEEAAHARDDAARERYGEFGRYNFPRPGERGIRSDDERTVA